MITMELQKRGVSLDQVYGLLKIDQVYGISKSLDLEKLGKEWNAIGSEQGNGSNKGGGQGGNGSVGCFSTNDFRLDSKLLKKEEKEKKV
jgi:hypothetical protein